MHGLKGWSSNSGFELGLEIDFPAKLNILLLSCFAQTLFPQEAYAHAL